MSRPVLAASSQVGELGIQVARLAVERRNIDPKVVTTAMRRAASLDDGSVLAFDLARILLELGQPLTGDNSLTVSGIWVDELVLDDPDQDLGGLVIRDSVVDQLVLPRDGASDRAVPLFAGCHIGHLLGRLSERDLPLERFDNCEFGSFSQGALTTDALLRLRVPLGARLLMTVLKKLYAQRGRGRKEAALTRGLKPDERKHVAKILEILQSEGLALSAKGQGGRIWLPVRSAMPRVFAMLDNPAASSDPAILQAGHIE